MSLDFYPCQLEETFVLSPSTGPLHQITNMLACSRDVIQKYGYGTGSSINEIWFREKITFFDCSPLVTVLKFSNKTIRRGPGLTTFSPAGELDSRASMPREDSPSVYAEVTAHDLNHRLRPAFGERHPANCFYLEERIGLFEIGAKGDL